MSKGLFTTKDVRKITGETNPRIQHWVVSGLVVPANPGEGTGTSRMFSFANLAEIEIIQELVRYNYRVSWLRAVLQRTRRKMPDLFELHQSKEMRSLDKLVVIRHMLLKGKFKLLIAFIDNTEERRDRIFKKMGSCVIINPAFIYSHLIETLKKEGYI